MLEIKRPKYLSPSAISTWLSSKEQFFLKYLAVDRPPRILQTQAMSVGSAFDTYIKCFLYARLFGTERAKNEGFDFDTLFERQVEPQNRDFALKAGAHCYQSYKASGALATLLSLLKAAREPPRFEFTAMGTEATLEDGSGIGIYNIVMVDASVPVKTGDAGPVVLLGKPDLHFITKTDISVVDDWKVNGYCSASGKKPVPGYMMLLDGFATKSKHHGTCHKDCIPHEETCGLSYNLVPNIELQQADWARQLAVYSWLCGSPVGSDTVIAIDQLCCMPSFPSPMITVAQHRCMLTKKFQVETYQLAQEIWDTIHSDHIFRELSLDASRERCTILMQQASAYQGDEDKDEFLRRMRRGT
jgi:hypothetical protein